MSKFTNSPLATIRQLNNAKINGSGNYTRTITKITPHHAAGVINGANLLAWMNNPACGASCNYVIGNDGVIGQQIEECNRAWTSSSPSNDYQAVTIEIGNSTGSPSWQISDKALSVLIDLCVDICKRNPGVKQKNGQPGIYYDGTPNASLTFHEMFASTNCPGAYIKGKVQYICGEVNKRLAAVTPTAPQKPAEPTTPATNSGIKEDGIVEFKSDSTVYYPGSTPIPTWVKSDFYHVVTQTTVGGKPVIKGDVTCVLLGKKVEKTRSTESAGINSWIDKGSLIIIRKGG